MCGLRFSPVPLGTQIDSIIAFSPKSMFKKQRFSAALFALFLMVTAEAAMARSVLRFRGPNRGTPVHTRGAASRGPEQLKRLQAIAPRGNFGFTTDARPSILVYVPKNSAKLLKFGLKSPDGRKTLFKKEIPAPNQAGIIRLELGDAQTPSLELNKEYRWYVSLFDNVIDRSTAVTEEGRIERIQPDAKLQQQIKTAKSDQLPALYADNSIWWNTVLTLHRLRRTQPNNAIVNQQWNSLLASVDLKAISTQSSVEITLTSKPE